VDNGAAIQSGGVVHSSWDEFADSRWETMIVLTMSSASFWSRLALRGTASSVVAKAVVTCGILASRAENTYDTAINIQLGR
jgi:hypothetical protein